MKNRLFLLAAAVSLWNAGLLAANKIQPVIPESIPYADIADSVSAAPIVAIVTVVKAKRLRDELAVNVPEGHVRFLVEADLVALLRGDHGLPARIEYLVDVPVKPSEKPPKLAKRKMAVAATSVSGKPGMVRLVNPRAQMAWSPALEEQVRAILTEVVAANAPPRIIGVGNAFYVGGSLPGESETQIFLRTTNGDPVSLNVLRRPGEDVRWAVALGELVDESARPPEMNTLLWYRLACFLPPSLPDTSVVSLSQDDAVAANADYRFVIEALGPCVRRFTTSESQKDDSSTPTPPQSG